MHNVMYTAARNCYMYIHVLPMNGYRREPVSHQPENQVDLYYVVGVVHRVMLLTHHQSCAYQEVALFLSDIVNIVCVCV